MPGVRGPGRPTSWEHYTTILDQPRMLLAALRRDCTCWLCLNVINRLCRVSYYSHWHHEGRCNCAVFYCTMHPSTGSWWVPCINAKYRLIRIIILQAVHCKSIFMVHILQACELETLSLFIFADLWQELKCQLDQSLVYISHSKSGNHDVLVIAVAFIACFLLGPSDLRHTYNNLYIFRVSFITICVPCSYVLGRGK